VRFFEYNSKLDSEIQKRILRFFTKQINPRSLESEIPLWARIFRLDLRTNLEFSAKKRTLRYLQVPSKLGYWLHKRFNDFCPTSSSKVRMKATMKRHQQVFFRNML